jgi:class 3 adenylate cyclase/tetratricopeptide (TPR) repeat protein
MRCSSCGFENSVGRKFCSECGTVLPRGCPQCGADNAMAAKFCGECGAPLNAAAAVPLPGVSSAQPRDTAGERRHLTVMFCDLVGSTEISARLDPEEWREIEADYLRAVAETISRFDGFVAKYLGDGVMAYFGWPEAHDNDAERAARAGLAIVDAVGALNQRDRQSSRPKLSVRVGIDSGTVVIGKGGGSDSEVFGDTANIAARVQSAGAPDTVIVTPAVHRLVSGLFVVEECGAYQLKGIAEPVELYRIVRLSGARSRLAASAVRGLTPFVGRADEMALLWNRWERASDGEGQVVLIVGEAGIGKSRLVRQFRERLAGTPHTWNECAGASYFQNTPFYPITDMLQQGFTERGDKTEGEKLSELERVLELAGLKPAEAVPLIAPVLNVSLDEKKYPPLTTSPEQKRKRLLTTLVGWLFGVARTQPSVMAVEDLHWFDASTLELMQLLMEQGATSPLLLLSTARPEFHAPWTSREHHTHLILNRLTTRDVRELVGQVVATSALSGEAIDKVIERTGGVPLFVEELTRAVLERGDAKPTAHEIPATLHDSLMARLDRLGPAKEVAQIASVIGREFSYELLQVVSAMHKENLQSALARLAEAELIYARGIPPEANYTFKHALIQDAAYDALLKSRRRELHRRVAVAMTETFRELAETQLELVARHWTDAAEAELAIAAWKKAGEAADTRRAFKEAEEDYRQALAMLDTLAESPERDARELELASALAQVLTLARGYSASETVEIVARTRALAEKSGDLAHLVVQGFGVWAALNTAADFPRAAALADQILDLAQREGSPTSLVFAHQAQTQARFYGGDPVRAEEHFTIFRSLLEGASGYRQLPGGVVIAIGYGSLIAWNLGRADLARERIGEAITFAEDTKSPYDLAFGRFFESWLYRWLREPLRTAAAAAEVIAISEKHGFTYCVHLARHCLGWARAELGSTGEGISLIRQGLAGMASAGARVSVPGFLICLAEAQTRDGRIDDALSTIDCALQANPEELAYQPQMLTCRGDLRLRLGHAELAKDDFREAIALAQKMSAKTLELRAATSLARMLQARSDLVAARDLLSPLYNWFTEGFDTPDLKDAKVLIDELGH